MEVLFESLAPATSPIIKKLNNFKNYAIARGLKNVFGVPADTSLSYDEWQRARLHSKCPQKNNRPANVGSKELNKQENEMLFSLLAQGSVSLTAAVVQLLIAERGSWRILLTGVASLIKDYQERAYFIRIFDILDEKQLWSFRLYKGFRPVSFSQCQQLLAFDSTDNSSDSGIVYGLNFANIPEACEFKNHLERRHAQERKTGPSGASV
ncbi:unnamed protein product [Caenorhabditis auriculariae]|uniref:WH1 domain-containing protein n=1 Tax=Caenorhabditis auriculariae TaxID=2777116 RepID=A0A8S1HLN2_9PELO|nr:unnamed protein product [Caenorhabditis auriculariae]